MLAVLAFGCAGSSVSEVRFANAPAVRAVEDRHDVSVKPATSKVTELQYQFDSSFYRPLTRALELPGRPRALGVNALDEVPDSTWFTNRIGIREITPEELRRGPGVVGTPEAHFPWTIHSSKVGGWSVGFIITDARGVKFLLKFDSRELPEAETAAQMIAAKLLWASGYNVTDDYLVHFRREDLVLAPDAVMKEPYGDTKRLDLAELDRRLAMIAFDPGGRIRGLASVWLEGQPLGGHPSEGVRADDPNDRIPHERRRDLRGAYALFAWLDQGDVKQENSVDTWITDPRDSKRHYVKHFLIDFGKSFGLLALSTGDPRLSHEYRFDWEAMFRSVATAGLEQRTWERRQPVALRGVGMYDVSTFDPGTWKAMTQAYVPFLTADRFDKFWGTKIMMRFTREQIRAAVGAGELSDPRAAEYLVTMLVARQRATGRYWFARVNPLDQFVVTATGSLCFEDLGIVYGFNAAATTAYTATRYDQRGNTIGAAQAVRAAARGRTCVGPIALADRGDGYTIVRIATSRPGFAGSTDVHLARDPLSGAPRVIGLWRP